MGGLIESIGGSYPELSQGDEQDWTRTVEQLSEARISSDIYTILNPAGSRAAVIGPWYLPYDALALQLVVNIGPSGKLYSVDPQGGVRGVFLSAAIVGLGDSNRLQNQLRQISSLGVSMAPFEWLGPFSSLVHIPSKAKQLDLIADHETLKFVSSKVSVDYLRKGVFEIISSLRRGGFWIHHGDNSTFLDCIPLNLSDSDTLAYWSSKLGVRILRHQVQEDSYVIPASKTALQAVSQSSLIPFLIPNTLPRGPDVVFDDGIHIDESRIKYPRRWVFVAQKI